MMMELIVTRSFAHFALGFWVSFLAAKIIWSMLLRKNLVRDLAAPLHIAFWGGVANILVDLDHIALLFGATDGKMLHYPIGIASVVMLFSSAVKFLELEDEDPLFANTMIFCVCLSLLSHIIEDTALGWF